MKNESKHVAVLGAGAWGTALASVLVRQGRRVVLWGRNESTINHINSDHQSSYLPGISLPGSLVATTDLGAALTDAAYILVVIPSSAFADVITQASAICDLTALPVAWATKGVDPQSGLMLDQLLTQRFGVRHIALVSGPSFAQEVANEQPTAINVVSHDKAFRQQLVEDLTIANMRLYESTDLLGSQLCGIYKNVIAIAAGACDGMNLGNNARAALLTRGLTEMMRLVVSCGGDEATVYGLCGLGDMLLTATGDLSRNRRFGLALASTSSVASAAASVGSTIEGKSNVDWLLNLAQKSHIELPICAAVADILHERITLQQAVVQLLARGRVG